MESKNLTKEYSILFNAITDTINNLESTLEQLKSIQCETEEMFIRRGSARAIRFVAKHGPDEALMTTDKIHQGT